MAIPLTPLAVGFSALFAEAIPSDWHVAASATLCFPCVYPITLKRLFSDILPAGYQIVLGSARSAA
jgi:hypothetical protein